ncbi:PREDICTED: cytochrome b5-like [Tarenaya hassleriana]|uniref:cytochrome b5-like n=1 Tax=Tarenaya hassleriana TaxID=28532 RepID=UPI00053CA632|nr:PREDICTED: cytochrome b5-like [Tarenaya hassleriana]
MTSDEKKVLIFEEVSKHNKTEDCWLVISGKGNDFEDIGHSDTASDMMKQYYIGETDPSTVPPRRTYAPPQQARYEQAKTSDFVVKILQFLVPVLIVGLALAVRRYTKKEE